MRTDFHRRGRMGSWLEAGGGGRRGTSPNPRTKLSNKTSTVRRRDHMRQSFETMLANSDRTSYPKATEGVTKNSKVTLSTPCPRTTHRHQRRQARNRVYWMTGISTMVQQLPMRCLALLWALRCAQSFTVPGARPGGTRQASQQTSQPFSTGSNRLRRPGSLILHYSSSTETTAPSRLRSPMSPSPAQQFYKQGVLVGIETTGMNSRRISGEVVMDSPLDNIWSILKDYDSLSQNVPNLIESKVTNPDEVSRGALPRVYQRGAQVRRDYLFVELTKVSPTHLHVTAHFWFRIWSRRDTGHGRASHWQRQSALHRFQVCRLSVFQPV